MVVKNVALSVVGGRAARRLISKAWATFNWQGLIRVDEGLANRERYSGWAFKMHGDERSGHRWIARQKQRSAFLEAAGEAVADRVRAQVGSVVAHADDDRGLATFGAARLAEVDTNQLHHVRFEEIDVPPRAPLHLGHGARLGVEERRGRTVDGFLRDSAVGDGRLHRRFSSGHVQHYGERNREMNKNVITIIVPPAFRDARTKITEQQEEDFTLTVTTLKKVF